MKTAKFIFFFVVSLLCLSACEKEDNPKEPTKPEVVKSEISIDANIIANGLSFSNTAGEQSISFTTNENWTLSVASTTSGEVWCTASATNGAKGSANVKFTVKENTSYDDRSVSVTIKSGTASKTFKISQKCANALLLTTNKYELSQSGGTIDIEVKANIDYKMEISENAKTWITESSTKALTSYKHKLNVAASEEVDKRKGEIYFKSGDKTDTVKVYQAGGAIIMLTQNEYTVSSAGDTISVDIKSNFDFGVQMPSVDWILDEATTKGLSSHALKYIIAPNEEYNSRSAEIIFYDKNSELKDTLRITQMQNNAILVANNEYKINSEGGILEFDVNANVDFEVSVSVDWIKQDTETRAMETKTLSFTIDEYTSLDNEREGLITISSGELKQEIKIIQTRKIFFNFSKTDVNLTSDGGEFSIEVSTNGGYTITMPEVDWLTQGSINETSNNTFTNTFIATSNGTYDNRETEIIFKNIWTDEVVLVKVTQAQKDAIVISKKTYDVRAEGETIEVNISANVEYEITIPDVDWIEQITTRALQERTIYFKVAENKGYDDRSVNVVFINKECQLRDTIVVHQESSLKDSYANGIVTVATAGTMKKLLGDDYLNITSLKVVGYINGDDVYYLRKMLGGSDFSETNRGILTTLDLSEATIIKGGGYYYLNSSKQYYTSNDIVGDYMFYDCSNLQNIVLPNNVIKIGKNAFSGCTLNSITLGKGLTLIDEYAFGWCNLNSIVIPDNVTKIGRSAFSDCTLNSITLGKGLTLIDEYAFNRSSSLTSIAIPDNVIWIGSCAFWNCTSLTSVTIGSGVTSIGDKAFSDCTSLTSVTIGSGVTSIGERAFHKCSALTSIVIPDNVTAVPKEAFMDCIALNTVAIGNGVISIKESAFYNCSALASVTIGGSVTSIDKSAFYDCSNLTSIVIPDNVTSIGSSAFSGCSALTSVTLGKGLKMIYDKSFSKCSALTSIVIPDNVTGIGEKAFYECRQLKSVTIGSRVSGIGGYAFDNCSSLKECYCHATTPPIFAKDIYGFTLRPFFSGIKDRAILYVPERCETAYISSKWSEYFGNIKEMN